MARGSAGERRGWDEESEEAEELRNEDGVETWMATRMAAIKKGALGLLKKIIVLFLEILSLFWVVEAFEEIIESTYRILLKREILIP